MVERYRAATARLTLRDDLAAGEIGWRMALLAAEARGPWRGRPSRWDAVRPALAARPAPFLEAYVLWRTAEVLAAPGGSAGSAAAAEPLREAHAIATRIGAGLLVAVIEGLGRRLRIDLAPRDRPSDDDHDAAGRSRPRRPRPTPRPTRSA